MSRFSPFLLPVLAMMAPLAAEAAESGQIRGRVLDASGNPLAGVEVTLSGDSLAGEISTTTGDDGSFRFASVPAGVHSLLFLGPDQFAPTRVEVTVRLDEASFVPITMQAATESGEVVTVEEALPVIDTTRSAFSSELSAEMLQNLPVGRSYQDAVNMLPGVSGRIDTSQGGPGDGNPSVRGEGQYGNNFQMDGVSTRDPATKTFGSDVNFDAIEDIQVYTDGAPAEFGQFAGMLVNVVTKDGGDEHHGSVGYWLSTDASWGTYDIANLETHLEVPTSKRDFVGHEISVTAGGPIVKEKLWYFGAVQLGADTAVYEGGNAETPYNSRSGSFLGKLTYFPTPDITLRYMFNGDTLNIPNYETSSQFLPESQSKRIQSSSYQQLSFDWGPDAATHINVRGGLSSSRLDHIPMSNDHETPSITDLDTGQIRGNFTDFDLNRRGRVGGAFDVTRLVEAGGSHKFKAGGEYWILRDERDLQFTGEIGENAYRFYSQGTGGYPCENPVPGNDSDCQAYDEYDLVGPLPHRGAIFSAFIQDDWQPIRTLTLNVGARFDREALFQNEGQPVFMDDPDTAEVEQIPFRMNMPAPRLGLAWDVTGDNKTLVSANAGRYYDIAGNSFADWADTKSAYGINHYERDDNGDMQLVWTQDPTGNPLVYDSHLKPASLDKLAVQVKREILPSFALSLRGIVSKTTNIPEDVDTDLNVWYIANTDIKRRDYRAIELTADKKMDERWAMMASYTLSEAKGTSPGQFETASGGSFGSDGNNVGVFLDDVNFYTQDDVPENWAVENPPDRKFYFDNGLGWLLQGLNGLGTTTDDAGWYGYLPYHSFHAIKINGSYTLPEGTNLGLVYEFDSGHAWQRRTFVDLYGDYVGFAEGRGTRFMPAVNYIDVRAAHEWQLSENTNLELTLDVFNLPDFKTATTYYENDDENFALTLYRQQPRSVRVGMKMTY